MRLDTNSAKCTDYRSQIITKNLLVSWSRRFGEPCLPGGGFVKITLFQFLWFWICFATGQSGKLAILASQVHQANWFPVPEETMSSWRQCQKKRKHFRPLFVFFGTKKKVNPRPMKHQHILRHKNSQKKKKHKHGHLLDRLEFARINFETSVQWHVQEVDLRSHQVGHWHVQQVIVTNVQHLHAKIQNRTRSKHWNTCFGFINVGSASTSIGSKLHSPHVWWLTIAQFCRPDKTFSPEVQQPSWSQAGWTGSWSALATQPV